MITLFQGEQKTVVVPVVDADTGQATALSTATQIKVELLVNNRPTGIRYALTEEAGYGELDIQENTNNLLLKVMRADSKGLTVGSLKAAILVVKPDDLTETAVTEHTYTIGEVKQGILKDESIS